MASDAAGRKSRMRRPLKRLTEGLAHVARYAQTGLEMCIDIDTDALLKSGREPSSSDAPEGLSRISYLL